MNFRFFKFAFLTHLLTNFPVQMALDLGGAKNKKKKSAGEHRIIQLDLFKPTKKKYPVFDFEEIRKEQLVRGFPLISVTGIDFQGEKDDSGDERFHDSDALELVRRLEAKYVSLLVDSEHLEIAEMLRGRY